MARLQKRFAEQITTVWPYASMRNGSELCSYVDWMDRRLGEPDAKRQKGGKQLGWAVTPRHRMQTIVLRDMELPAAANKLRKNPPQHLVFHGCRLTAFPEWDFPLDHTEVSFRYCKVYGIGAKLLVGQLPLPACQHV